jgi:RNA polymerase sigma-70 factor (ECF subfamily)
MGLLKRKKKTDTLTLILHECSSGDRKAQEHLYRDYYGYAMSIALRFSDSREAAVEILNDSFLKVFQYLASNNVNEISDFKPWLRRILINKSVDHYRSRNNKNDIDYEENLPESVSTEDVISKMSAEDIILQLQKLPDMYRLVFVLYEIEGYSHNEISKELNISETASRKHLSRAKGMLRTILIKADLYG